MKSSQRDLSNVTPYYHQLIPVDSSPINYLIFADEKTEVQRDCDLSKGTVEVSEAGFKSKSSDSSALSEEEGGWMKTVDIYTCFTIYKVLFTHYFT